jgi:hypothetical protein
MRKKLQTKSDFEFGLPDLQADLPQLPIVII